MEKVLDVYRRPYDAAFPVVCMDETPRQLISETREPVAAAPGRPAREDYEYRRCGSCNVFMATEPLAGRRMTKVTARRTKTDWAYFLNDIAERHPRATTITLVMDNLNTHRPGALYEAFAPAQAKALWDRFEFVYTPKHGSWLNVAEVELNVLTRQCLNRRIASLEVLRDEVGDVECLGHLGERPVSEADRFVSAGQTLAHSPLQEQGSRSQQDHVEASAVTPVRIP